MWTNTLKGALGNVKDAWNTLEQSLDAAVGQTSEVEDITIPPPTGSTLLPDHQRGASDGGQGFLERSVTPLLSLKSPKGEGGPEVAPVMVVDC